MDSDDDDEYAAEMRGDASLSSLEVTHPAPSTSTTTNDDDDVQE
jgi:hypothetical protein